jgi:hypothetical protein
MEDFDEAVQISLDERFVLTRDLGMPEFYDILLHFSSGGTVHNHSKFNSDEITAFLGAGYATMLIFSENLSKDS